MPGKQRLDIEAQLDNLSTVRRFIEESCREFGARDGVISDLRLAVDEAVTNIIIHGYQKQGGNIHIEIERDEKALIVRLRDDAVVFDPASRFTAGPPTAQAFESPGKLGIPLIQRTVDHIDHRVTESGGNELTLKKRNGDIFRS